MPRILMYDNDRIILVSGRNERIEVWCDNMGTLRAKKLKTIGGD